MAHLIRIIKAINLKSKWFKLVKAKQAGLHPDEESEAESIKVDFGSKLKKKIVGSAVARYFIRISAENSMETIIWKSLLGFIGGVLLSYLFFFFFYVGMNISLRNVTYLCGSTGILLCLGLAFSSKVRCYVFLLLPVFFSKQGRQALIAYALFLAFTGPGKNTMHNMGILSDSMTCGQQMIKRTLIQLIDMVKAPFKSVKETIQKITETIKNVVEIIKDFVSKIKRIIISVLNVIKKVTTWLGSIVNFCNKKIGTPFQRCMKTFDAAIMDCKQQKTFTGKYARIKWVSRRLQYQSGNINAEFQFNVSHHGKQQAKLGIMDFMCHVVHVVKGLCYTVKWLDFICMFTEFVSETVVTKVKKKLREFSLHMKNLFYVSVDFSHAFAFETSASNSTKEVAKTILQRISEKVERVQTIFGLFGFLFGLLFFFVFYKVYYYKYKYLSSDKYDNYYISNYIIELDLRRARMDKETVLPLEQREKKKYARPTALRLLKAEKSRMAQSVFLLTLTSFKIVSFLVCDYSLFWVLNTIYEAGKDEVDEIEKPKVGIHVKGKGVIARFYENLGNTFQVPDNPYMHPNPLHCLPDPVEPDTGRYIQIGFLLGLSWLLALFEPYGLRLRNIVMSHYYPDRARERAVWLYNHILRCRGSFIRFARRQLRRKFLGDDRVQKVSIFERIFASFPLLGAIFGKKVEKACILCGAFGTPDEPLKRCKTPECKGKYCAKCFATIQNICTLCQHPIEYGDISDISEEMDSSDDESYRSRDTSYSSDDSEQKFVKTKKTKIQKSSSNSDDSEQKSVKSKKTKHRSSTSNSEDSESKFVSSKKAKHQKSSSNSDEPKKKLVKKKGKHRKSSSNSDDSEHKFVTSKKAKHQNSSSNSDDSKKKLVKKKAKHRKSSSISDESEHKSVTSKKPKHRKSSSHSDESEQKSVTSKKAKHRKASHKSDESEHKFPISKSVKHHKPSPKVDEHEKKLEDSKNVRHRRALHSSDESEQKLATPKKVKAPPRKPPHSDEPEQKFMTFKDLEHRERFRDLEANKKIDYAKVSDLQKTKKAVKKKLKEVVIKRMNALEAKKKIQKVSRLHQIKLKIREILNDLKNRKSEQHQELKSAMRKKLRARSDLGPLKPETENPLDDEKPSKVSFLLDPEVKLIKEDSSGIKKEELVEEIIAKIRHILQTKRLKNEIPPEETTVIKSETVTQQSSESSGKSSGSPSEHDVEKRSKGSDKSNHENDDVPKKENQPEALTYYFVESEKKPFLSSRVNKMAGIEFEGPRRRFSTEKKYHF